MMSVLSKITTASLFLAGIVDAGFKLFAYPTNYTVFGEDRNRVRWHPINREDFYQICYNNLWQNPNNQLQEQEWKRTNRLKLFERGRCPEGWSDRFSIHNARLAFKVDPRRADEFRRNLFDPEAEGLWQYKRQPETGEVYIHVTQSIHWLAVDEESMPENSAWRGPDGYLEHHPLAICEPRHGADNGGHPRPARLHDVSYNVFPEDQRPPPIWFNSNLAMGDAHHLRNRNGELVVVDFYQDRDLSGWFELVGCPEDDGSLTLKMADGFRLDRAMNENNCFKVQLTTSPNQLAYMKDQWNMQQRLWFKSKLDFRSEPLYLSNYILEPPENLGGLPKIYRRGDPEETPFDFSNSPNPPLPMVYNEESVERDPAAKTLSMLPEQLLGVYSDANPTEYDIARRLYPAGWWNEEENHKVVDKEEFDYYMATFYESPPETPDSADLESNTDRRASSNYQGSTDNSVHRGKYPFERDQNAEQYQNFDNLMEPEQEENMEEEQGHPEEAQNPEQRQIIEAHQSQEHQNPPAQRIDNPNQHENPEEHQNLQQNQNAIEFTDPNDFIDYTRDYEDVYDEDRHRYFSNFRGNLDEDIADEGGDGNADGQMDNGRRIPADAEDNTSDSDDSDGEPELRKQVDNTQKYDSMLEK